MILSSVDSGKQSYWFIYIFIVRETILINV